MAHAYSDMERTVDKLFLHSSFIYIFLSNFWTEHSNESSCFIAAGKWFSKVCIRYQKVWSVLPEASVAFKSVFKSWTLLYMIAQSILFKMFYLCAILGVQKTYRNKSSDSSVIEFILHWTNFKGICSSLKAYNVNTVFCEPFQKPPIKSC